MKRKKMNKKIIGVISCTFVLFAIVGLAYYVSNNLVVHVSAEDIKIDDADRDNAIATCGINKKVGTYKAEKYDDKGNLETFDQEFDVSKQALNQFFGFDLSIPSDANGLKNVVQLTVKNGKFKVIFIQGEGVVMDQDYYYTQIVDKNNPLNIYINENVNNVEHPYFTIRLGLAEGIGGCASYDEFYEFNSLSSDEQAAWLDSHPNVNRADKANNIIATYETGDGTILDDGRGVPNDIIFYVPNLSKVEDLSYVTNEHYSTYCKALRDGDNSDKLISDRVMKLWSSSYIDTYKSLVPTCWDEKVLANLDPDHITKAIQNAIVFAYNEANNTSTSTDSSTSWSIDFNSVKNKAIANGNAYTVDIDKNTGKATNWYYYDENQVGKKGNVFELKEFSFSCKYSNDYTPLENVTELEQRKYFDSLFERHVKEYKIVNDNGVDKIVASDKKDSNGKTIYNISANEQYYYAYSESRTAAAYTYNYTSGSKDVVSSNDNYCQLNCEEAVRVNYGPPVAATAGICFEYQIQVTSKIKCTTENHLKPPEAKPVCSPVPYCNDIPGYIHQAGPLEEYESCIQECDGGKFTKACSNKCYKNVYGDNDSDSSKLAVTEIADASLRKVGLLDADPSAFDGRYLMTDSGYISWQSGRYSDTKDRASFVPSNTATYSRYYRDVDEEYVRLNRDDRWRFGGGYVPHNGFKTFVHWNGSLCNDPCRFTGCSTKSYLNTVERDYDYNANMEIYKEAVNLCSASASCNTTTAKFTMSVKYSDKNGVQYVTYPYDSKPVKSNDNLSEKNFDTLTSVSLDQNSSDQCTGNPKDFLTDSNHTVIEYGGCYQNCGNDKEYHTRWSIPGSWQDDKTKEIYYYERSGSTDTQYPNRFCLKMNIKPTNESQWKFYYAHQDGYTVPSFKDSNVYEKNYSSVSVPSNEIDWNITGKAIDFGHYGWNFNFKCFYSYFDEKKCSSDGEDCSAMYRVKSVDLSDLFPDRANGTKHEANTFGVEETSLPFNWGKYAVPKNGTPETLFSDPIPYAKSVQTIGNAVYDDDTELEYHFHLTPATMRQVKKIGTDKRFEGKINKENGVAAYSSNLIRRGSLSDPSIAVRVPGEKVLGCSNIKGVSDQGFNGTCDVKGGN